MNHRYVRLLAVLMLLCSSLPFGITSEAAPPNADPIELREVTFAHGLTDDMQAIDPDPAAAFTPDETIYLALVIKGRPKSGLVAAHFYWGDDFIKDVAVDLADTNSDVLFSFGQDTFVGYHLAYEDTLIISDRYRAEVFYDGEPLGVYPFRVIPPPDAIPSKLNDAVLARGAEEDYTPIDITDVFDPDEEVYLVGNADLGLHTWIQANWYANGAWDEAGTRSFTMSENADDVPFSFAFLPDGGWHTGTHTVTLTLNDVQAGVYPFRIGPSSGAIRSKIHQAVLARGADDDNNPINPTDVFAVDGEVYSDEVFLVGSGDLGKGLQLGAEWYVNGELDEAGTRRVPIAEDMRGTSFYFSFVPDGGWPIGTHTVTLMLNDIEVGAYSFTMEQPLFDEVAFLESFPLPDDAELVEVVEGFDGGFASSMTEPELFDAYGEWLEGQGWTQQAPAEAMVTLPHQVWRMVGGELLLEMQGLDDQGRTVLWLKVTKVQPYTLKPAAGQTITPTGALRDSE